MDGPSATSAKGHAAGVREGQQRQFAGAALVDQAVSVPVRVRSPRQEAVAGERSYTVARPIIGAGEPENHVAG